MYFDYLFDQEIIIWDLKEKNKIKSLNLPAPITCAKLSRDGNVIAYGVGNDWNRGLESLGKIPPSMGAYVVP